jgi:hypothetical protein
MAAEENARWTVFLHILRGLVDAYGRTQFELRRQSDPELEAARPACFVEPAAVPHTASSLHPFDAAGRQCAFDVVRVDIADGAFRDIGQGGDTRVGVEARAEGRALMVEKVEKHKRLQDLAEIGRAHQTCGGAVRPATSTLHDRPR